MSRFVNKVSIITGGSRGIGFEIAASLGKEGSKIVLIDIDDKALEEGAKKLRKTGVDVITHVANIANKEQVENAVKATIETCGKIDILVNNAGIVSDNLVFKMTDEDWQSVQDVNLTGTFNCIRSVQKHMVNQKYGRIVNISSTSALGNKGQVNYSAAKAGIQGLTKTLAIELGRFGITTNSVAPGFIETEMSINTAERIGITFEEFKQQRISDIPVGRIGNPKDISNAVTFFCDEASSFVNGQILYVSGGPTV